jgi:hypothetical protein
VYRQHPHDLSIELAASISHHWLDSTHVSFGVVTLGWVHDDWKLEVSQFTGREPDQFRFNFDPARFDSTSANQFSFGAIAATPAFGNKHLSDGTDESAGLLEAQLRSNDAWTLFGRAETTGSNELVPGPSVRNAGKFSFGAIHNWRLAENWKFGLGGLYAFDFAPSSATDGYGGGAHGAMGSIRIIAE